MRGFRQNCWVLVGFAVCLASGCASYNKQSQGTRGLAAGFGTSKPAVAKSNAAADVRKKSVKDSDVAKSALADKSNSKTKSSKIDETKKTIDNPLDAPYTLNAKLSRSRPKRFNNSFPPVADAGKPAVDVTIPFGNKSDSRDSSADREDPWKAKPLANSSSSGSRGWEGAKDSNDLQKPAPLVLQKSNDDFAQAQKSARPALRDSRETDDNDSNRPFAFTTPRQQAEQKKQGASRVESNSLNTMIPNARAMEDPSPMVNSSGRQSRDKIGDIAPPAQFANNENVSKNTPTDASEAARIPSVPSLALDRSLTLKQAPALKQEEPQVKHDTPALSIAKPLVVEEKQVAKKAEPFLKRLDPPNLDSVPERKEPSLARRDSTPPSPPRLPDMGPEKSTPAASQSVVSAKPVPNVEPFKLAAAPKSADKGDLVMPPPPVFVRNNPPNLNAPETSAAMEQQPARPKQDTLVANNNVPVKQPAPAPAALALEKLQFVQQVTSFGVYEQLPASWITPGAEMLLYVEVRNFTSQKINDQYQTNLASRMMIENPQGDVIAKLDFDTMQDASESQRKDFFCRFNFELPPSLVVGQKYVLRLLVRDLTGNQTAQQTLEFTPTSP